MPAAAAAARRAKAADTSHTGLLDPKKTKSEQPPLPWLRSGTAARAAALALGWSSTGPWALRVAPRRSPHSAPPRGAVAASARRACLMLPRSCLEIRTRHHVKPRWQSLEDMRAPGAQAGRGEPGPEGRDWGVGGRRTGRGRGGVRLQRRPECGGGTEIQARGTGAAGARCGVRVGDSESLFTGLAGTAAGLALSSGVDPQERALSSAHSSPRGQSQLGDGVPRSEGGRSAGWRLPPGFPRPLRRLSFLRVSCPPGFLQDRRQRRED